MSFTDSVYCEDARSVSPYSLCRPSSVMVMRGRIGLDPDPALAGHTNRPHAALLSPRRDPRAEPGEHFSSLQPFLTIIAHRPGIRTLFLDRAGEISYEGRYPLRQQKYPPK
jgi:hypothetical protein